MLRSLALLALLPLAACQPAPASTDVASTDAAAATPAPATLSPSTSGPSTYGTGAPADELMTIAMESGLATISFDAGRTLTARLAEPQGRTVSAEPGGAVEDIGVLMGDTDNTLLLTFAVSAESNAGEPLCGAKPTTALAVLMTEDAPQKLAAITGALPGEPGALLCNIRTVTVSGL
jgi:hypothetical protein